MKSTIEYGLTPGRTGLEPTTEKAVIQMRDALNRVYQTSARITTEASGAATTIWTSPEVPQNSRWDVTAHIQGETDDGVEHARYILDASFFRPASGGSSQLGTTTSVVSRETTGAMDGSIGLSGETVVVNVNDGSAGTMKWVAWIEVRGRTR